MDHTAASSTATAAAATASSTGMSMGGGSVCKISMLWNWYTVDSCFIARSWHVTSKGAFAGSCIGVILLVVALEFLRRSQRELDRYLRRLNGVPATCCPPAGGAVAREDGSDASSNKGFQPSVPAVAPPRLKLWQQLLRAALFTMQFAVGYFIMLLAMYYNGYIIICIFLGAFVGAIIFQWDTFDIGREGPETRDSCCN